DTVRFLEISEEVERLNTPTTAEMAMRRLIQSLEGGEFDCDGHPAVYVCGSRWAQNAHDRVMARPIAERETGANPNVYRIPKTALAKWAARWKYVLPDGMLTVPTTAENSPPPETPAVPSSDTALAKATASITPWAKELHGRGVTITEKMTKDRFPD